MPPAGGGAPEEVDGRVVGQPEEEGAHLADAVEQAGLAGQLDEKVLEQVARVGFVAGEVQEIAKDGLSVLVIDFGQIKVVEHGYGRGRSPPGRRRGTTRAEALGKDADLRPVCLTNFYAGLARAPHDAAVFPTDSGRNRMETPPSLPARICWDNPRILGYLQGSADSPRQGSPRGFRAEGDWA